ncbi:MAG: hypothetical protein HC897_04980 [Thermoanaerobaculia bacterium]|nr:hypothetical protein [Thermoanaerobaculia bacterium]
MEGKRCRRRRRGCNDLRFCQRSDEPGGGYVVCGAQETTDEHGFARLERTGLSATRLKEVEGTVLARCRDRVSPPLTPLVDELPADVADRRVLVFTIATTRTVHAFRRDREGSVFYVRVGRSTRQARNGVLLNLLAQKGVIEPWAERPCAAASPADLDLLAIRDTFQRMNLAEAAQHVDVYLSDTESLSPFIPPLCTREPLAGALRPRNFTLLLFATNPQRFVQGAVSGLSIYPGADRATAAAQRLDLAGTILEQFRRLWLELRARAITIFDKTNLEHPNLELYPSRALLEALVNAIVHRDYSSHEPTRVTIFSDRIELHSPGGLPAGVSLAMLRRGKVTPKWRNRSLAWSFRKLGLAQAEGQGVSTIRRAMKAAGCPPPRYQATETDVTCTLFANPRALALQHEIGAAFTVGARRNQAHSKGQD